MPPPETYKSEIGSQSTMCQVQAGAYVSFLTPGETNYSDCHPRKTTTYTLHVVPVSLRIRTTNASQLEKNRQTKEDKGKERKDKQADKRKRKGKKRENTRKARKGYCCCCSHIDSHNQVRGHRAGSSYPGAEEYPR